MSTDLLVVSVDSTSGWQAAARELAAAFTRVGARVQSMPAGPVPRVRTYMLTDFVQARAARRVCLMGIAQYNPAAIVYCSMSSALLWPKPGVVWFDSLAAENRPGRHGVWQRVVERRRLEQASMVLTMSDRSMAPIRDWRGGEIVIPTPVESSAPPSEAPAKRDIAALTYAGNPDKKRMEFVLAEWSKARRGEETLLVAGVEQIDPVEGVEAAGRLSPDAYRALLRRARVFVAAPKREDYGIAPLEALADGCVLVSAPAPGPYPALDLARELDPRLVGDDLASAIRVALDDPVPGYVERAAELLSPFRRGAVDRTLAEAVLPRLLPGFRSP
jgi:hypothetical protein